MEKVTFITTVKNDKQGTEMLLSSLLSQTRAPDEVIIVDAMSSDETMDVVNSYEAKYKKQHIPFIVIRSACNRAEGRNIAIERASHPIIVVSDAGCLLHKDWLLNITAHFENSSVNVVAGFYKSGAKSVFQKCMSAYTCVMSEKLDNSFLPSSRSIAFRKTSWQRVGGYPEYLDYCEDLVFARSMKNKGLRFVVDEKAYVIWPQVTSWLAAAKQFFMYARGDGQAQYVRPQTPFLFGRYAVAVVALVAGYYVPIFHPLLLIAFLTYLLWAAKKNYHYVRHPSALIMLPMLQLIADIAVMTGMSMGYIDRAPIAKATLWQVIGKMGAALFGLVAFSLLARTLSPSGMSAYSYIISISVLLFTIADVGMDALITRESAENRNTQAARYLGLRVILGSVMAGLCVLGGLPFMLAGVAQLFFLLSNGLLAYQKGKKAFFLAAKLQVLLAVIMFVVIALGALLSASVHGFIALGGIASVIAFFIVKSQVALKIRLVPIRNMKELFMTMVPYGLASLVSVAYLKLDMVFLGYYFPPETFSDVGLYAMAYRPFELAIVLGGLYTQTLLPYMALKKKDTVFIIRSFIRTFSIAGTIGLLLYIFAPHIVQFIGGPQYLDAVLSLRILSVAAIFTILAGYAYTIIIAHKEEKLILYSSMVTLLVNIILNILLIPSQSFLGASWATVCTQGTLFISATIAAVYVLRSK